MTEDLQRELRELPPSMDLPNDFYDRVMGKARRRQRVMRAAVSGLAAVVVSAIVAGGLALSDVSSTARIEPITPPPAPSTVAPSPTPTQSPSPSDSPSAVPTAASPPPSPAPATSAPAAVVDYPPLTYANLPYPSVCPTGYIADNAVASGMVIGCVPPDYMLTNGETCPAGSSITQGGEMCYSLTQKGMSVAVSGADLPPIADASLPKPACQSGYAQAGWGPCAPDAYVPRAGYACPAETILGSVNYPGFCFTSEQKDVIVAPVPTS